ncbi:hypothetical protein DITRI_Ditri02bG0104400 [Diplodiscus trichospermus]
MRMATAFSASSPLHHHNFFTYSNSKCFNSDSFPPLIYSPFNHLRRSAPIRLPSNSTTRPPRCLSSGPGPRPPSPSDSDPLRPPGYLTTGIMSDDIRVLFLMTKRNNLCFADLYFEYVKH